MKYKKLKIAKKSELSSAKNVIDLTVQDTHNYVSKNGIINHNSGIVYNASITIELSAAKLDDKENDNAAKQKAGTDNAVKTGVLVTAKPVKNRFARPIKIKFGIPFYKNMNPYIGLEQFMTWDNSGVCRGNLITQKDYDKLSEADKKKIYVFEFNGETKYCQPKDTARGIVVKHLGKQVSFIDFYTNEVFTDEFLKSLNENVIKPLFQLPDRNSFEDIKELEESLTISNEHNNNSENINDIINDIS